MDKHFLYQLLRQEDQDNRSLGTLYRAGDPIFHKGDTADCLYVIQKGKVEILLESLSGENQIGILGPGDVFGETSLFAEKPRFITVRALTDTRALKIDKKTFLTKLHLDPSLAYGIIRKMAQRIYELDSGLMHSFSGFGVQDKLTGFSSYQDIGELLEGEVERAKRLLHQMAFVVLDIEHFDEIQSFYGALMGEQVLMALSQLMIRNLNKTDIIGRYGRDRFGIILFETDGPGALKTMREIHASFSAMSFQSGEKNFSVAFSCGIALLPEQPSAAQLRKAANEALKIAKRNRTNQPVFLAEPHPDIRPELRPVPGRIARIHQWWRSRF